MLKAKLIVVGGAKTGEINLSLPSTIGRGREASITLPHPLVSRLHCEFYEKEGKLFVKDLDSMNGTFINNHRIAGEHVIEPQQLLTLGDVTFRASYEIGVQLEQAEMHTACVAGNESGLGLETQLAPAPAAATIEVPNQTTEPCEKETLHGPKDSDEQSDPVTMMGSMDEMKSQANATVGTCSSEQNVNRTEVRSFEIDLGRDLHCEFSEGDSKIGSCNSTFRKLPR